MVKHSLLTNTGDMTFTAQPPKATMLHALTVPPWGGDTLFADQYGAYDSLSDGLKCVVDGLDAEHTGISTALLAGKNASAAPKAVRHPVVRVHPETNRKALFITQAFVSKLCGWSGKESRVMLNHLYSATSAPELQYRHKWRPGDVVIWDNRCTQHYAVHDHGDAPRVLYRMTLEGDTPVGCAAINSGSSACSASKL